MAKNWIDALFRNQYGIDIETVSFDRGSNQIVQIGIQKPSGSLFEINVQQQKGFKFGHFHQQEGRLGPYLKTAGIDLLHPRKFEKVIDEEGRAFYRAVTSKDRAQSLVKQMTSIPGNRAPNYIIHNANFEIRHFDSWFGGDSPFQFSDEYRDIIFENRKARALDTLKFETGSLSGAQVRANDVARQMKVYRQVLADARAGGKIIDSMELAKTMNAIAQKRNIIPGVEIAAGTSVEFLAETLLGKKEFHRAAQDVALQNTLAPKLVEYIEEMRKPGFDLKKLPSSHPLKRWADRWQTGALEIKVDSQRRALEQAIENIHSKGYHKYASGRFTANSYKQFTEFLGKTGTYKPQSVTQGMRVADYGVAPDKIVRLAEKKLSSYHKALLKEVRGQNVLGSVLRTAPAKSIMLGAGALGLGAVAYNAISGKDDDYNTIEGLRHGWFGESRKYITDFGSGFQGGLATYKDPTPTDYTAVGGLAVGTAGAAALWNKPFFGMSVDRLPYTGPVPSGTTKAAFLGRQKATFGDFAYNLIRRAELSMAGIPKTFGISTLLSPGYLKDVRLDLDIGKKTTSAYSEYLNQLTGQNLTDYYKEVSFRGNKLYGTTYEGAEQVILKQARLYQRIHDPNISKSVSQFAKSYENIVLSKSLEKYTGLGREYEFLIAGDQSRFKSAFRATHAFAHETLSKYLRLVDDPIEAFRKLLPDVAPGATEKVHRFTRMFPKFGVGGEKQLVGTVPQLLLRHTKTALPKLLAIPFAIGMADWAVKKMSPEGTVAEEAGLTGLAGEAVKTAHLTHAKVSDIAGLTDVRKSLEEEAPGSTGLLPALGVTLTGLVSGTAAGMFKNVFREATATKSAYEIMLSNMKAKKQMSGFLKHLPTMKGEYTRAVRYGKMGALLGAALSIPMLLGGIGSKKSFEELQSEYSGETEVPIRKGRWWEFGKTPWEGDRVTYYRQNWYARMRSQAKQKAIYGDNVSPLESAVRTFLNPYWVEEMHYKDRPYPITGSGGEGLGLFGPLWSRTIGRVIKPPAYMHMGEWDPTHAPEKEEYASAKEMGGIERRAPIDPYSWEQYARDQWRTGYEAAGLRGFATSAIKQAITGEQEWDDYTPILQSSQDIETERRDYWDLNLGGLAGLCFAPDQKVRTQKGYKKIKDIQIGEKVLSLDGKFRKIIGLKKEQAKLLYETKISTVDVTLISTPTHEMPIYKFYSCHDKSCAACVPGNRGKCDKCTKDNKCITIRDVPIQDVQEGDYFIVPISQPQHDNIMIDISCDTDIRTEKYIYPRYKNLERAYAYEFAEQGYSRKEIREKGISDAIAKEALSQYKHEIVYRLPRYYLLNNDILYILGWYAAEGSLGKTCVQFSMHANEINYANKIKRIILNEFNTSSSIRANDNQLCLKSSCPILSRLAAKLVGEHSHHKFVSSEIMSYSDKGVKEFLKGYLLGDGWCNPSKKAAGYRTASEDLCDAIYNLILRFGAIGTINRNYKEKSNGFYPQGTPRKDSTSCIVKYGIEASKIINAILLDKTIPIIKKNGKSFIHNNKLFVKIRSASFVEKESNVYDLMVEGMHYYNVYYIACHNTEPYRRFNPKRPYVFDYVNEIKNTMPEWMPGDEYYINFRTGDPYCVTESVLINTSSGLVKAKDIKEGTLIKTHKGVWRPVKRIALRNMNVDEKAYRIKTTTLSALPLELSEEHPLWTPSGWVKARDIKVGDYVGYPMPVKSELIRADEIIDLSEFCTLPKTQDHIFLRGSQEYADCVYYIENIKKDLKRGELKRILAEYGWDRKTFENAQKGVRLNNIQRIPRRINTSSKEWGIISGYYLSEGSTSDGGALNFAFNMKEQDYHSELMNALESLLGINSKIYSASTGDGCSVIGHNKPLSQALRALYSRYFNEKKLVLWEGSYRQTLKALYNGDGSFFFDKGKPRLSLKLENLQLLYDVREVLLMLGYIGSIVENNLILRGQAAKDCAIFLDTKYKECIDSIFTAKHSYIKEGYAWMRVFAKEEISPQQVYGFEVDMDDSFCAAGVATHNTKVEEGEYRLPGKGYEARYPEVEGLNPEDYPLIHKYKILADVAMYSKEFKSARAELKKQDMDEYQQYIFDTTEAQIEAKRKRKRFWKEDQNMHEDSLYRDYSRTIFDVARGSPLEELIPLAPAHKFLPAGDALSQYEESIYGKDFKLWQRPLDDFIKPFITSTASTMGAKEIPTQIGEAREIEEYFDELQYVKFRKLERQAIAQGDEENAKVYKRKWSKTVLGADPYAHETRIRGALPKREREYFDQFIEAPPEEREEILELIPENLRGAYIAQWDKQLLKQVEEDKLVASDTEKEELKQEIFNRMQQIRSSKARTRQKISQSEKLPEDNWIGWNPNVDLEDVKLKYLIQTGRDYHYYDLWDDRLRALGRKPYLSEALEGINPLDELEGEEEDYAQLIAKARKAGIENPEIILTPNTVMENKFDLEYTNEEELREYLRELGRIA